MSPERFSNTPIAVFTDSFNDLNYVRMSGEHWKSFQELIQRGSNLWPDAPPEIKEFADLVTNGKVMQDYYRQANQEQPK